MHKRGKKHWRHYKPANTHVYYQKRSREYRYKHKRKRY